MHDTSEADADLNFSEAGLDRYMSGSDKELRNIKRGAFLLAAVNVLMLTALAWKLMKPDMSTYDGTAVLIAFLVFGFLAVLIMLAFVLLKLSHIRMWMERLEETIEGLMKECLCRDSTLPTMTYFQVIKKCRFVCR